MHVETQIHEAKIRHVRSDRQRCKPRGVTRGENGMTKGKLCLPSQGDELYSSGYEVPLSYSDSKISEEGKGQIGIVEKSQWE